MLTQGEDVEVHALHQRGWSISAIARQRDTPRRLVSNEAPRDHDGPVEAPSAP